MTKDKDIYAYLYIEDESYGYTALCVIIPVLPREKPEAVEVENPHYVQANALAVHLQEALDDLGDITCQVTAARVAAENAEAYAESTYAQLSDVNTTLETLSTETAAKIDDGYVEDGSLYLTSNGEVVAGPFTGFGGGGGTGSGGSGNNATLIVQNATGWLSKTVALGAACNLTLNWSSLEDNLETGAGVLTVKVNNAVKLTRDIDQGSVEFDISPYLSAGSNAVKINIADVYGNSKTINYSVKCVSVSLTSTFDAAATYSESINFVFTPTGSVAKTMHFVLDGKEIGTMNVTVSGRQQTYVIPRQTHGAHILRAWFTCEIDGEEIESNELYYEIICIRDGNSTPIIASNYTKKTAEQYELLAIPYRVYDPANITASVSLYADGTSISNLTVDRTEQTWSYRPTDIGALQLKIVCGSTEKYFDIDITESSIDVEAETQDLSLYLSSYGHSNSSDDKDVWSYGNISAEFKNFGWVSDGWQLDEDNNTVLRVTGDARVEIPVQIFAQDFRSTGKTIEIEFASRDVLDYNAMILSSVSEGRGIEITAQRADMTSEQSTIGTQYKEDEHVRLTFVTEKRSGNRLILIYLNGIISGIKQYPDDDDFSQGSPVGLSIGSNDCTIDIYNIRVYDNDLTRYQVLDNWIADTQNIEDRLARYERNLVYDDYGAVV